MNRIALLFLLSLLLPSLALGAELTADSIKPPDRLLRYYPQAPFDRNGSGYLLALWLSNQESTKPRRGAMPDKWSWLKKLEPVILGPTIRGNRWEYSFDGVSNLIPEYNKADGLWIGYEIQLTYKIGQGRKLMLRTSNNTTTGGAHWYTENNLLYYYAPEQDGLLVLSGGYTSRETVHLAPGEYFTNYYIQPLGSNSVQRNYRKLYASLRNRVTLLDRWDTSLLLSYEHRTPQPKMRPILHPHQALSYEASLSYTVGREPLPLGEPFSPVYYPRAYHGTEIGLTYRGAVGLASLSSALPWSRYHALQMHLRGNWVFDLDNKIDFTATTGGFIDRTSVSDADEWTLPMVSIISRLPVAYHWVTLPEDYTAGKAWSTLGFNYYANRLALSRIPFAQRFMLDEALHFKAHTDYQRRTYMEMGYSLGWGPLARIGVFGGKDFSQLGMRWGFSLSLPIFFLTSSWSERY